MNRRLRLHWLLLPFALLYRFAVGAKNAAHGNGWASARRLQWPVISVGNLSVGGAGKTPFTIYLARLLTTAGFSVDVLSRGYGRSGSGIAHVDAQGSAAQFGDEPILIAREAQVPVFVGADRYAAGRLAEKLLADDSRPHVHLLDDGFQHRRLARDLDIVLIHGSDLDTHLLPAGRLREPLRALRRAHVVVVREGDRGLDDTVRRFMSSRARLWHMRRTLQVTSEVERGVAVCAIAHPSDFAEALRDLGINIAASFCWRDHHRYTIRDIRELKAAANKAGADAFITTAKDAVKLKGPLLDQLQTAAPLIVARLAVELLEENAALREISNRLSAPPGNPALPL
jgi:tetraacyldisaccharide 4'-kinase